MTLPLPTAMDEPIESLLPFAKIRLVVVDVDGTLLDAKGKLWANVRQMFQSLRHYRYDVTLTVATGRTFVGVRETIRSLPRSLQTPVILYNGAVITESSGRLLDRLTINRAKVSTLLEELARSPAIVTLAYYFPTSEERLLGPIGDSQSGEFVLGWGENSDYGDVEFNGQTVTWLQDRVAPSGLEPSAVLLDTASVDARTVSTIIELIEELGLGIPTRSGERYLEIRPYGSNKWRAVLWVAGRLGLGSEAVLTLGDSENDMEMLSAAGIGVAVRNAPPKVVAICDYASDWDAASGVLDVLRLVKVARRYAPQLNDAQKTKDDTSE